MTTQDNTCPAFWRLDAYKLLDWINANDPDDHFDELPDPDDCWDDPDQEEEIRDELESIAYDLFNLNKQG